MHPPSLPYPNADAERTQGGDAGDQRRDVGSRSSLLIAWLAALTLIAATVAAQSMGGRSAAKQGVTAQTAVATDPPPGGIVEIMGRYVIGAHRMLAGGMGGGGELTEPMGQFADASPAEALRVAIVEAEAGATEAARERLRRIADDAKATPETRAEAGALAGVYASDDKRAAVAALEPGVRDGLRNRHGWFGELALSAGLDDNDPARAPILARATRTMLAIFTIVAVVGVAGLVGLVLLILALIRRTSGGLRDRYHPPAPGGSVYLEAFALFLAGFLLLIPLSVAVERVAGPGSSDMLAWLLALAALWPLARGTPWRKHRYAMGWHAGAGVAREIGAGIMGYLAGLPIFALGVLLLLAVMFVISAVRSALGMPPSEPLSHPIVNEIAKGGVWGAVKLYLLAAVWAPLVEESIFRGALYHHLRGRLRPLSSGLLVGFVFAVIHPQGIAAVPALMALAVVFSLMREWRGSLIAPITAHALHNGTLVTAMLVALS